MVKPKLHQIFLSILKIGVLGYGGGPATIPLFHKEVIEKHNWMTDEEFSDMLAIANTLPGPTQTKLAGYIGYHLKGILGLILGLTAIILPSLLLMIAFLTQINKYKDETWISGLTLSVLPIVGVLMARLTFDFFNKSNKSLGIINNLSILFIGVFVIAFFKIHPAFLIMIILISSFIPNFNDLKRFLFILTISLILILLNEYELYKVINESYYNINIFSKINIDLKQFQLFISFLIPGIIGYGGGPASIPLVEYEVVQHFKLITSDYFGQLVAVQATLPGVTATKLAGTIGYLEGGILGCLISVISYILPSLLLMITLLQLLNKYKSSPVVKRLTTNVRPIIVVLLGMLTYRFFKDSYISINWLQTIILTIVSFILLQKYKVHPFFVILGAMLYGAIFIR